MTCNIKDNTRTSIVDFLLRNNIIDSNNNILDIVKYNSFIQDAYSKFTYLPIISRGNTVEFVSEVPYKLKDDNNSYSYVVQKDSNYYRAIGSTNNIIVIDSVRDIQDHYNNLPDQFQKILEEPDIKKRVLKLDALKDTFNEKLEGVYTPIIQDKTDITCGL